MVRTTILCVLLVFTGFSIAHAQNPFKGKSWYCVKSIEKGEMAANKTTGDSHGVNKRLPEYRFYYIFQNEYNEGDQHISRFDHQGTKVFYGTWKYNGDKLSLIKGALLRKNLPLSW